MIANGHIEKHSQRWLLHSIHQEVVGYYRLPRWLLQGIREAISLEHRHILHLSYDLHQDLLVGSQPLTYKHGTARL